MLSIVFDTEIQQINTLIIENQTFMKNLLKDIYGQLDGFDGQCIVSEKDTLLSFPKRVELLDRFVCFDINQRHLISKLINVIEQTANQAENYEKTMRILSDIERYLYDLTFDLSGDIVFNKLSIASIVKYAGLEIRDSYQTDTERIIDYMELVREYEADKLFITYNMRVVVSDHEMQQFVDTVLSHGYHLLMIENQEYSRLIHEKRWIIDSDLCEIG